MPTIRQTYTVNKKAMRKTLEALKRARARREPDASHELPPLPGDDETVALFFGKPQMPRSSSTSVTTPDDETAPSTDD